MELRNNHRLVDLRWFSKRLRLQQTNLTAKKIRKMPPTNSKNHPIHRQAYPRSTMTVAEKTPLVQNMICV